MHPSRTYFLLVELAANHPYWIDGCLEVAPHLAVPERFEVTQVAHLGFPGNAQYDANAAQWLSLDFLDSGNTQERSEKISTPFV